MGSQGPGLCGRDRVTAFTAPGPSSLVSATSEIPGALREIAETANQTGCSWGVCGLAAG